MTAEGTFAVFGPWAVSLVLVLTRVSTLVMTSPVFSSMSLPNPIKVGLVGSLTLLVMLQTGPLAQLPDYDALRMLSAVFVEAVAGAVMGIAITTLFAALSLAGQLIGIQMGLSMATIVDPVSFEQSSVMGQMLNLLAMMLFLMFDGHLMLLRALFESFQTLPLGASSPDAGLLLAELVRIGGRLFELGLRIAMPVVGVVLFINVGLAVVSRIVPQVNVFQLGFLLTIGIGLVVFTLALPGTAAVFRELLEEGIRSALRMASHL